MDRTRGLSVDVAGEAARHGEPGDQISQAESVAVVFIRVELLQRSFQPESGKSSGRTVAGPDNIDHIKVMVANEEVQV